MSNNYRLFSFLVGFYCLLFFAFNVKSYILIFLFAFGIFFFYFRYSLIESAFLLLVISLPFENNLREWIFQVTNPLFIGIPTSGYSFNFGISLKLIFGLFLFLLLLIDKKKLSMPSFKKDWPLIIFFVIACINTLTFSSILPILGLVRLWLSILIYFSAKIFFKSQPNLFPIIISAIFIFSTIIGLNQLIRQKPLGKFIELTPSFSQEKGYFTTDGPAQYRVSGFISHPVYFGSFMSILLPVFITYALSINLPLTLPISLIGIIVILGTHSRSVWLTLALSLYLLIPSLKQKYYNMISNRKNLLLILVFSFLSLAIIISRIQSFTKIFSENGNASIRLELIWQSLVMISRHPLGVGLNQFTVNLIDFPLSKSLNSFIVPVHNTFLIITTELGILAGSLYIYFVIKPIFFKKINASKNIITYGAIIGAVSFLISSQFHPLLNIDPTFDLFMLTLGYINSKHQALIKNEPT